MGLVSIIIPTFNRSKYLIKAINSALDQTYNHIEVIVVDDGSTDDTDETVATFGNKVKYLKKHNGGVSSARNLGIQNSAGEFIAFLDSDDIFLPEKLRRQVDFLSSHTDYGLVLSDCHFINPDGMRVGQSLRRKKLPHDGNILESVILQPSLIPSSAMVRRDLLVKVGMFDETLKTAEDLDLHLKLACVTKIGLIAEPLFEYRIGNEKLSSLSVTYDDHAFVIERFLKQLRIAIPKKIYKRAFLQVYQEAAIGKFWMQKWGDGLRYSIKMLKYSDLSNIHKFVSIWVRGFYRYLKS